MVPFAPDSTTFRYCLYHARPCQSAADVMWRERVASDIAGLEIRAGSHAWRGFAIGSAACGAAWALVSPLAGWGDWTDKPAYLLLNFLGGAIVFAPTCGGLGALFGSQSPRWGPPPN